MPLRELIHSNYTNKALLISVLISVAVIVIYNLVTPTTEEFLCNKLSQFNKQSVNGIVTKKYIDTNNHNFEIIEIRGIDETNTSFEKLNLSLDTSNLYKLIEVGDTLTNEVGSIDFQINSDTTISLDFGVKCTESLTQK